MKQEVAEFDRQKTEEIAAFEAYKKEEINKLKYVASYKYTSYMAQVQPQSLTPYVFVLAGRIGGCLRPTSVRQGLPEIRKTGKRLRH